MNSGVYGSLHPNCHHHLACESFDLKVFYPPPYERTVYHYMQANTDHVKRAIGGFNWKVVLTKRDTNDKHLISNETITNIMGSFTPKENIFCKDRDALWMNL